MSSTGKQQPRQNQSPLKKGIRKHGSHAVIATVLIPEDASEEEFKDLMVRAAEGV